MQQVSLMQATGVNKPVGHIIDHGPLYAIQCIDSFEIVEKKEKQVRAQLCICLDPTNL